MRITQEELNSRVSQNSNMILLIFKDQNRLRAYQNLMGIDNNRYYATESDLEHFNYLAGKIYLNWHYVDDNELQLLKAEYHKNIELFKRVNEELIN